MSLVAEVVRRSENAGKAVRILITLRDDEPCEHGRTSWLVDRIEARKVRGGCGFRLWISFIAGRNGGAGGADGRRDWPHSWFQCGGRSFPPFRVNAARRRRSGIFLSMNSICPSPV